MPPCAYRTPIQNKQHMRPTTDTYLRHVARKRWRPARASLAILALASLLAAAGPSHAAPVILYPVDGTAVSSSILYILGGITTKVEVVKINVNGKLVMPFIGRAHSASLLPEVMPLIAARRLRPEEVTTRVVDWEHAPEAWLDDTIKLVVERG